jgi:hypothetical protein
LIAKLRAALFTAATVLALIVVVHGSIVFFDRDARDEGPVPFAGK